MNNSSDLFRWTCLGVAVVALGFIGWAVNDLRLEMKNSARQVNKDLPRILENTKKSTEALAVLSQDLKNIRNLAVGQGKTRDKTITVYGDDVLSFIEQQNAKIGVEKFIGKKLKDPIPAKEWVVGARREATYLAFRVRSKQELLEKLCESITRRTFYIQFEDQKPVPLLEWLQENHPGTKAVFAEPEKKEES